ncbi:hypothetical protein [Comamonas thiooxydans]|uniref:hypothetical protein n=1 Tax=Comamonas thiooxydans TaxID=363952 RepID=UPI00103CE8AB|nr:hypothetical protein [Comamonas thiooxydans]
MSFDHPDFRNERLAMRYGWQAAIEHKPCLVQIQEPASMQAAPAAVAVPDDHAAFERELIDNHHYVPSDFTFKDGFYGGDDDYIQFGWDVWKARAALAATPAAVEAPATERMMELVDAWFGQMKSGNVISQGMARQRIVMFVEALAATPAAAAPVVLPEPAAVVTFEWRKKPDVKWLIDTVVRGTKLYTEQQVRALLGGVSAPAAEGSVIRWVSNGLIGARPTTHDLREAIAVAEDCQRCDCTDCTKAMTLPLKLVEAINTAVGSNEWQGDSVVTDLLEPACRAIASLSPQAQADARDALTDSALLDAMERQRIAVVPEYEGPWDAEVYNGDEKPNHCGSGSTPREAIRAAIAAQAAQGGE